MENDNRFGKDPETLEKSNNYDYIYI